MMTLEAAHQLLVEIISECKPFSRHRDGVLGSAVGFELAKRQAKGLYREFGYDKLVDFVRAMCQPPLVVRPAAGTLDVLIDLADPNRARVSMEAQGLPRGSAGLSSAAKAARVEPRVWMAVLSSHAPKTYINSEGRVFTGEMPPSPANGWMNLQRMPPAKQAVVLEETRERLMQIITNAEVRSEVLAALEKAKASEAPILEFSNTMTALYRSSVDWNIRRISAVFGYVLESTGIDLRSVRGTQMETPPRPISDRPTSEVVVPSPRTAMPVAPASEDVSRLRQMIKDAIDMMNVRDLLEMKLPVESLYAVMTRRLGERS